MYTRILLSCLFTGLLATSAVACGGDDDDDDGATGSSAAGIDAYCAKACQCAADGKCRVIQKSDTGSTGLTFDNADDCKTLLTAGGGSIDWGACQTAVAGAQCIDDGGGAKGMESPAACDAP